MLLCGVPVEDRQVLQLAGLVDQQLGSKLITACRLRHGVAALNARECEKLLAVLDDAPPRFAEMRGALLREREWRLRKGLV